GGSSDTWSVSPSQAQVTSSNFGVVLVYQKNAGGAAQNANVYRVRMTIEYTAPATLSLSGYRIFENNNATSVSTALANLNTSAILTSAQQAFRLRTLVHVADTNLNQNTASLKLQYADKGVAATCSDVSNGTFAD